MGPLFDTEQTHSLATQEIWYYEHQLPAGQKSYSKTKPIRLDEFDTLKAWWTNREDNEQAWRVPIDQIVARNYDLDIKNPHRKTEETFIETADLFSVLKQSMQRSQVLLEELEQLVTD